MLAATWGGMGWREYLWLFLLGLGVSTPASMIGLAGGAILSPLLIMVFGLEPRLAIGATVLAAFLTIVSASLAFIKKGRVDYKLALLLDALDVLGVALGAYATIILRPELLALALGIFLLFSGSRTILGTIRGERGEARRREQKRRVWRRRLVDREGKVFTYELDVGDMLLAVIGSFFSGLASGMLGLGGGVVDLSVMLVMGVPFEVAAATAMFGMLITRVSSITAHAVLGNIRPEVAIPLGLGSFLGGQIGPRLSGRVSSRILKLAFALLASSLGLLLVIRAAQALWAI